MQPSTRREARRSIRLLAIAIGCLIGVFVNFHIAFNAGRGAMDFNQFYAASRLAGTGHLYDWAALRTLETEHGPAIHSGRLPVVAYGLKILSWMPYPMARLAWLVASIAALIVVGVTWPGADRLGFLAAFAWSTPVAYLLGLGQDLAFWLLFFTIGIALLKRGNARLAGLAFALCICKYHLAAGIPVLLIAQKRWKTLQSGGLAVAALLLASFVIEGIAWPVGYLRTLASPDFSPAIGRMPNLHGLAYWLPAANLVEIAGAATLLVLLWMACRRTPNVAVAGAAAASCGLLLGHHGYIDDCALLIPFAVLTIQSRAVPFWLRASSLIFVTPLLTLLLISSKPFLGETLEVGLVAAALTGLMVQRHSGVVVDTRMEHAV